MLKEYAMSIDNLWRSPEIVPIVAYVDVPRAAELLIRAYGFAERSDARLTWDGGCMTWMEVGDCIIRLASSGGHDVVSPNVLGGSSQALKVYVDDVDAHFTRAQGAGAIIISRLEDGFWGGRIYRTKDIEEHLWEFSQKGRDLAAKDWRLPPGLRRGR